MIENLLRETKDNKFSGLVSLGKFVFIVKLKESWVGHHLDEIKSNFNMSHLLEDAELQSIFLLQLLRRSS